MIKKIKNTIVIFYILIMVCLCFQISSAEVNDKKSYDKVKKYLNSLKSLEANFVQVTSDGNIKKGKIYISIPGKLRISYEKPNDLLITSKGFWLVVQDRKLKQTNNYPLHKTPLNLFLNKKLNFNDDDLKLKFEKESGIVSVEFLNNEQLIGRSFKLIFTHSPIQLKKWIITDEFDNQTSVLFQNLIIGKKYSHLLFFPEDFKEENN